MNKTKPVYYSLNLSDGRVLTPGAGKRVVIGQGPDADLRLSNPGPYEEMVVARVESCGPGRWRLIRLGRDYPIAVNGRDIAHVHYLEDGDSLEIGGLEPTFRFRLHEGEIPLDTRIEHRTPRTLLLAMFAGSILVLAGLVWWMSRITGRDALSDEMVEQAMSAVCRIEVDSLLYFEGDSLIEYYAYPSPRTGTAFLCTDSMLVTARHCVEPWLNAVVAEDIPNVASSNDRAVQLALKAETAAQLADEDDARHMLISSFTVTDSDGRVRRMRSSDFKIDRSRDEIIELGGWDEELYWRNIQARYEDGEMMLGDAVTCRLDTAGAIQLADAELVAKELKPRRTLSFLGFPLTQGHDETPELESDYLRQPLHELDGETGIYMMLAHGGRLAPGYSGGPVLMRCDAAPAGFVAVGVISVLDRTNGHRSYSVPVTSIPR
ncbi:MAG: FHA domain-containing protein [Muribaculaceae bacterium]|nr:FHA domain-containing protein [Muribaculaceae bacterium]